MSFKISKPGGRAGFVKDDHEEHLLAFVGVTLEEDTDTAFGSTNAARVETVVCLDHPLVLHDQLIFGAALVPRLTEVEDGDSEIVLGRLVKGNAMPGRNAPWLLEDPTDTDEKRCEEFFEQYANRLKSGRIVVEFISTGEDPDKF
jgi:hypothetical protein